MAEVRGSWNIHEAITNHWQATLDGIFRSAAGANDTPEYPTIHDTEARPTPPGPYCVYQVGDAEPASKSGGEDAATFKQYENVPVIFRVHAKKKDDVVTLVKSVAKAFDPENVIILGGGDHLILIERTGDGASRLDDTEWSWMLSYNFLVDATYDLPPARS